MSKVESISELYSIKDKILIKEWKYCPPNASFSMAGVHFMVWKIGDDYYRETGCNGGSMVELIEYLGEDKFQ